MNKKIERFEDLEVWKKAHLLEKVGRMLHGLIKSIQ
jgi:hypothetical protein